MTSVLLRLWKIDRPLMATAAIMTAALVWAAAGLLLDPRTIAGAPAWLKPAKFAISIAIYTFTLTWIFGYLSDRPTLQRLVSWSTSSILIMEVAIINLQAWRGTTSHFNVGTVLDTTLFSLMGIGILLQTLIAAALCIALWNHRFADPALGWAIRLGLTISLIGASTGGLMVRPTAEQLATAHETGRLVVSGAHTVGAPDGGPGLPGTKWSLEHGDLRVAHFLGLHALQALPAVALVLFSLGWTEERRTRMVLAAAASYGALFVIILWQALRGQSVVRPDITTTATLATWLSASLLLMGAASLKFDRRSAGFEARGSK